MHDLSAISPVVRILAFQASGPGSIPGWRKRAYDVTVSMGVL